MKITLHFSISIIFLFFFLSCISKEKKSEVQHSKVDIFTEEFPSSKSEIKMTLDSLSQSFKNMDVDKLLSFHYYSPKYSIFTGGNPSLTAEQHETMERQMFQHISGFDGEMLDLKIDVFEDVGIATFTLDMQIQVNKNIIPKSLLVTMVFIKTTNGWKITHEHSSAMNIKKE